MLKRIVEKYKLVFEFEFEWKRKNANNKQTKTTKTDNESPLTLKVLNFWKFTSYCRLKTLMVGHGGSSAGSYLAKPYIPHPLPLCINCRD